MSWARLWRDAIWIMQLISVFCPFIFSLDMTSFAASVDDSFRQHIALVHATLPDEDDQWTMHLGFGFVCNYFLSNWCTLTIVSAGP